MSIIIHRSFRFLLFLLLVGYFLHATPTVAEDYVIAQPPTWVTPVSPPSSNTIQQDSTSDGVAYTLVDNQWNIGEAHQEYYGHYANKALNISGVDNVSQITISFDPTYESVLLHTITLHRDGRTIDRINRARMDVIQRERDLENQIYDGSKTLNIFLEDIRVGDTVEYSYSIQGSNPAFSDHFTARLKMQWAVPVNRLQYRVLWQDKHSNSLTIKNHQTHIKPIITQHADAVEYTWKSEQIKALVTDKNLPGWFDPYPVIYLTDYADWQEVVEWAKPLYLPYTSSTAQQKLLDTLLTNTDSLEERILKILRFVQDDIRYLGIELGIRSYTPSHPDQVLKQRFGDCKDKSRLLTSLLKMVGVESHVALVNTYAGKRLMDRLPTPRAFNHVIVLATVDGRSYWLDPTLTYQRGNLNTLYRPDYGYALVISSKAAKLIAMADFIDGVHSKSVIEEFDISGKSSEETAYTVTTSYLNYYADSIRIDISRSNVLELQKLYLNYTASSYPDVRVAEKMDVTDNEHENRMDITEHYTISEIWQKYDDNRYVYASFSPFLIHDHLTGVNSLNRTMPYAVSHPVRFTHTTRIKLKDGADFDNEQAVVEDKAFRFTKDVSFSTNTLVIAYNYESLKDHVLPADIRTHSENIDKALDLADYQAQKTNPALSSTAFPQDKSDINPVAVTIFLIALTGSIALSWKFIYLYDPPYPLPDSIENSLVGLRGWLLLPGCALLISPISILYNSKEIFYTFSEGQWTALQGSFGNVMLVIITAEVIANVAMIVAAVFLLILFCKRRHTFSRLFVLYMIFGLMIFIMDSLVTQLLISKKLHLDETTINQIFGQAIYTILWVSYFAKSRRVKATFTLNRIPHQQNPPIKH